MILETCLTILEVAEKASKMYDWFTGLSSGERMNETVNKLTEKDAKVQRLSDRVLYAPDFHQAINQDSSKTLKVNKSIHELLNPVAEALEMDVLASAIVSTPEKLRNQFKKDPWELLVDVRPASRTKRPSNPDLLPITFFDNNLQYIGWQTRAALPFLFNCDFDSEGAIVSPSEKGKGLKKIDSLTASTINSNNIITPTKETYVDTQFNSTFEKELLKWLLLNGPKEDFYIEPNFPELVLKNTKSKFEINKTERILGLIDTCDIIKTGGNFLAFGVTGIYYHNSWNHNPSGFHYIPYKEFSLRKFSTSFFNDISLGKEDSVFISSGGISRKEILQILNGITNIVRSFF